jgi:pyruvate dehydrogenase E2 component (dihydrolipoamide acetyltransferase)
VTGGRSELILADLGLPGVPIYASQWLVDLGAEVAAGDRLLEVLAGSVTVDLPAPASGVLSQRLVNEDDELRVGQILAIIVTESA